jgi:hypothetical protein
MSVVVIALKGGVYRDSPGRRYNMKLKRPQATGRSMVRHSRTMSRV